MKLINYEEFLNLFPKAFFQLDCRKIIRDCLNEHDVISFILGYGFCIKKDDGTLDIIEEPIFYKEKGLSIHIERKRIPILEEQILLVEPTPYQKEVLLHLISIYNLDIIRKRGFRINPRS